MRSTVTLSRGSFEAVCDRLVPIDPRVLTALRGRPEPRLTLVKPVRFVPED